MLRAPVLQEMVTGWDGMVEASNDQQFVVRCLFIKIVKRQVEFILLDYSN